MTEAPEPGPAGAAGPSPAPGRRRLGSYLFLAFGLLVTLYLGTQGPTEQHVRIVLGDGAPGVTALDLRYLGSGGEVAREAHFDWLAGEAPRVVPHELRLPSGEYALEIDVDAREGRRAVRRRVTLGGGSTQVDVSSALERAP